MDYEALKLELSDPKYKGLSDAEIAAALVEPTVATTLSAEVSPSEFYGRFTPDEAATIDAARVSNHLLAWFFKQLDLAQGKIDLADQRIQQGLGMLVQAGLLTPERMQQIAAPATGPTISRAQQLGFDPARNDMLQEILAARKWK